MRIISDGTNTGTRVYTDDDDDITDDLMISNMAIVFDANNAPSVKITCLQRPMVVEIDDDLVEYDLGEA